MWLACRVGDTDRVRELLHYGKQAAANGKFEWGLRRTPDMDHLPLELGDGYLELEEPLLISAEHNRVDCVTLLLAAGASPNGADREIWKSHARMWDVEGWIRTPLTVAARAGHAACTEALLAAGASVDDGYSCGDYRPPPLVLAVAKRRTECAQLLRSYGAALLEIDEYNYDSWQWGVDMDVVAYARGTGQRELATWLEDSKDWPTPLHYLEVISPARTRMLLRAGADIHAARTEAYWTPRTHPCSRIVHGRIVDSSRVVPSPLDRAQALAHNSSAPRGSPAWLVLQATLWSRETHDLFPPAARARARTLLRLGHLLAVQPHFVGQSRAIVETWEAYVMGHAITRD